MKYLMLLLIMARNVVRDNFNKLLVPVFLLQLGREQTQQIWNQAYGVGSQVGVMF
jgi:hypothetical protein